MILVAGATGTIGRQLALELKSRKLPMRALTRSPDKARDLLGPIEFASGDLSRPETVARALAGVEAAFLLSPLDPAIPSWETGFVRAAKKAGVKRVVKLSALGADPRSRAAIARWHGEAEEELRLSGIPFTILRPGAFYQNLLFGADSVRRGTLAAPMGSARIAMVDAQDVAAAAAAALAPTSLFAGATLELTGPAPLSYAEIAALFSDVLERPVSYADVPPDAARQGMLAAGMPAWRIDALLELFESFRSGAADKASDGVLRATGWTPKPLERFLRERRAAFE